MRLLPVFLSILFLGFMAAAPGRADSIVLAQQGKPAATIVIPAKANDRARLAATELQSYIQRICDVKLPIQTDGKAVEGTGLYIGRCEPTRESDFPDKTLNPETYAITVRDGSIYFTGRYPTPTYFAVVSFIEDNLGVHWFAPGDLWTFIPAGRKGELTVDVKTHVKTPDVSPRVWSGNDWYPDWDAWNLHNKAVQSEVIPRRNFQNNMFRVFPPSKYAKTHPEYYPLVNGKRWIPSSDSESHWWPCISNPDVVRLTVAYADHYFDTHPDQDSFSLGMDDIAYMCGCDKCRAMDASSSDYAHRQFSDRFYKFINEVAREVRKTHPHRYIGTLIYSIARQLPRTVDKLEPNVFGFITERSFQWWQPGVMEADHELTRQWASRCRHLSRYDYYGMGTFTPRFSPHTMAEQMKFDGSLGFEGMYIEAYTFFPDTAPMMWALAKMQWDRSLDVDTLLNTFYTDMYGSAAPTMHQYFDLLEKSWNTDRPGRTTRWVHRNILAQVQAMSVEDLDHAQALLKKALSETSDAKAKKRIEINQAALRYGGLAIRTYALAQEISQTPVTDKASADRVMTLADQLADVTAQRKAFWPKAHDRKDLLGETIRGLGDKKHYLQTGKVDQLEIPAAGPVAQAMDWYNHHDPKAAGAHLKTLEASHAPFLEQIRAQQWVAAHHPHNLVKNGDFESQDQASGKPAEADWTTSGVPSHWSMWAREKQAKRGVAAGKGVEGSHAAYLRPTSLAVYIQSMPVKPGQRYFVRAQVRSEGGSAPISFAVRFHSAKGGWLADRSKEASLHTTAVPDRWQTLTLRVEIPKGAGTMQIMPGVSANGDSTVYFDNVEAYRLNP